MRPRGSSRAAKIPRSAAPERARVVHVQFHSFDLVATDATILVEH